MKIFLSLFSLYFSVFIYLEYKENKTFRRKLIYIEKKLNEDVNSRYGFITDRNMLSVQDNKKMKMLYIRLSKLGQLSRNEAEKLIMFSALQILWIVNSVQVNSGMSFFPLNKKNFSYKLILLKAIVLNSSFLLYHLFLF